MDRDAHRQTGHLEKRRRPFAAYEAFAAAAVVVYGSLLPFQFESVSAFRLITGFGQLSWHRPSLDDLVTNIVVYVVLGLLVCRALSASRSAGGAVGSLAAVAACALVSLGVELLQTMLAIRVSSWSDVALNVMGAAVGAGAWIGWRSFGRQVVLGWHGGVIRAPFQLATILITAAILAWSLAPFDVVRSLGQLEQQFRAAEWDLLYLSHDAPSAGELVHEVNGMLCFVMLGYLAGLAGRERGLRPSAAALWAARHVAVCAIVFELLQLLFRSHTLEATSMLLRALGGLIGMWLAIGLVDRLSRGLWQESPDLAMPAPLLALAAWVGIAGVTASCLVPGESGLVETSFAGSLLPFLALWMEPFGVAVTSMGSVVIVFGGIAAMLALPLERGGRAIPWVRAALTVAAVAATLELIQGMIPGRTVDPTIPLLAMAGAVLACRIAGWARMQGPVLAAVSN